MTSVARNEADGGGDLPTPSARFEGVGAGTASVVVIVVRSDATESSNVCNADASVEGKVVAAARQQKLEEEGKDGSVVVDVKDGGGGGGVVGEGELDGKEEKVCRICHLSPERDGGGELGGLELIQIGCGCKDDLGTAHRNCAEAWFRVKGNRYCEICGLNAKNINGEDDGRFMDEWYDRRSLGSSNRNSSERVSCWRGQPFCNFLMACLVIAFILPWFFRVDMF